MFFLTLPLIFLKFWYFDAPITIIKYLASFNRAFLQLISLPLLIRTFFRPWKNEYRKGLIWFSICMGIFIKSFVIISDLMIFSFVLIVEVIFLTCFLFWPIATLFLILN
ncbi:MAG: hypothetical protein AAB675_04595 [Patescibacteria group bacterium]